MELKELVNSLDILLDIILKEKDKNVKRSAVMKFNDIIFNYNGVIVNEEIEDIIYNLAMCLEYYEPNSEWREEDSAFFGDEEIIRYIEPVLKNLKNI